MTSESERKVKAKFSDAEAVWTSRGWRIISSYAFRHGWSLELGRTDSAHVPEGEAWADAASRLEVEQHGE